MARFFICQDSKCDSDHAYCHTCYKEVCEKGEADVHRSIDHEVQPRRKATSHPEGHRQVVHKSFLFSSTSRLFKE